MLVSREIDAMLAGLFGLLIGSFLNVVIHRLPRMLEQRWAAECASLNGEATPAAERFDLMMPPSHCPQCSHAIRWYENLPVLSYLALRGRCSACKAPIGLRYPLVELATGALFAWCVWQMPGQIASLVWCGFAAALLALALIDWDTTLLPDGITLPLLWGGLLAASADFTGVTLSSAVWGAAAGYASLWAVYWAFKLITGKEGMGYGDFKLFAALGAWFGWQGLIPIILMASVSGVIAGLILKFSHRLREGGYVPFGPFLAIAGFSAMLLGSDTMLRVIGF
jgi:leader peptidase (prepilin peptidase)/N-methyltransferase